MESRKQWGMVFWAGLFALIAIGTALTTSYFENTVKNDPVVRASSDSDAWKAVSDYVASQEGFVAPNTDSISKDLYSNYLALASRGSFSSAELDGMVAAIVEKNTTAPAVVPVITIQNLNLQQNTSLDTYGKLFSVILSKSSEAQKYELEVFTRTVGQNNANGTPVLTQNSELYARIAAALLVMETPPSIASEHLEVVKSIGALARVVDQMGRWKGDPIQALQIVDTFNKTERYVEASIDAWITKITALEKKS
ncbi:hypothetical protein EPO56_02840 [Patescibacteria group bacterium]|nr:MAG: hypothetical protein EPO56_02840 [Patescibacteria group bacterium]